MNIALVAHDSRKQELIEWVRFNHQTLVKHNLFATGTTGRLIEGIKMNERASKDGICIEYDAPFSGKVTRLLPGPLGGDGQVSAMIAEGKIDMLIFFCDNLVTQGHQTDVAALTRLASLYNIAFATNRTTADMLITSPLMEDKNYVRVIPDCIERYKNRNVGIF